MSTSEFSGSSKNISHGRGSRFPRADAFQQPIVMAASAASDSSTDSAGVETTPSTMSFISGNTDGKRAIVHSLVPKGRGRFRSLSELNVLPSTNSILDAVKVDEVKEVTENAPVEQFLDAEIFNSTACGEKKLDVSLTIQHEDSMFEQRPVQARKRDREEPQVILRRRPNFDCGELPPRVNVSTRVNLPGMGMRGVDQDYLQLMDKNMHNIVDINESWED